MIRFVDLFSMIPDKPLFFGVIEFHGMDTIHVSRDFIHKDLVVRWDELAAELIVYFFSIIGGKIVTGTEHIA